MNTQQEQDKKMKRLKVQLVLKVLDIPYKPIAKGSGCTVPQVGHVLKSRRDSLEVIQVIAQAVYDEIIEAA